MAGPNTLPLSFIYFLNCALFFPHNCIKLHVEWSLSVHQDLSWRGNETSLVGFIRGETNLRFQLKLGNLFFFLRLFFLLHLSFSLSRLLFDFVCTCISSCQTMMILVQMLFHENCVFVFDSVFLTLSSFVSTIFRMSRWATLYFLYPGLFCSTVRAIYIIHGMWTFSHILTREKQDNNFQKRWMDGNNLWQIYGDFLHFKCLTCTNKARLSPHHICCRWCWGNAWIIVNATRGCRLPSGSQTKPHYHKKLIVSLVRFLCFVFDIIVAKCSLMCYFCITLLRAAVAQALDWILKFL